MSARLRENHCPHCGGRLNMASGIEGEEQPGEGDLSFCIHCGELSKFGSEMDIVKLTDADIAEFSEEDKRRFAAMTEMIRNSKITRADEL